MKIDVINNAKRNIIWGIINKVILMICPFITRSVMQMMLGTEYLGLDGLFNSVISVLSLSELGFSSAVVFHLYKPASEGNVERVNAILNFYRTVYRVIGLFILFVGLALIPVLLCGLFTVFFW